MGGGGVDRGGHRVPRRQQQTEIHRPVWLMSQHAERISIASVKGVNRAILDRRAKLASELSRRARALRGLDREHNPPLSFLPVS